MDFPCFSCFIHFLPSPCVYTMGPGTIAALFPTEPILFKVCHSAMRLWWFSWTSRAWDFSRAFKLHWCGVRHDFCGLGGNFGSSTARMQACYWGWEKCLGKQERTHQANPQSMLLLRKSLWDGCGCPQWMSHVSCYFTTKVQRQLHRFWCKDDSGLVSLKKLFTS